MHKKVFILIFILMSFSLIGIIAVQVFWINNAVESRKEQFKNDVKIALANVYEKIKNKEVDKFYADYEPTLKNLQLADEVEMKNYLFQQLDEEGNQKFTIGATILEGNFKIPTGFLNNDSIIFKRITTKRDFFQAVTTKRQGDFSSNTNEHRFSFTKREKVLEKKYFESFFNSYLRIKPLNQRINNRELNTVIGQELLKRNIDISYKYGVYNKDGLATELKSGYYTINTKESLNYPLFTDEDGNVDYKLYVTFPSKDKHILSGISNILLLSLFFIAIIILAFSSSLYQLIQQKKLSEIKTDFINNMTHEFKTPIATINLALDSIKNPKIINDNEKVLRYVKMIREENKRMHGQVENVLRISRLEKNQIKITKDAVDMHNIIEDAITHISLLINDRKGKIMIKFNALQFEVLGNEFHLTNIIVNMLENALKYSKEKPYIKVETESTSKFFILKIKDKGIGMSKNAQKYAFDKFYREQKGNIHNVKGHGLGLAYVKEIIENHHGTVFVDSEKGLGSTFTIKIPLI